jgi:hypothetical protein
MQAQVVHHRKATLPWIPMLLAALFVFATVAAVQVALSHRGSPVVTSVDSVTGPGVREVGPQGAARIAGGEDNAAAAQKAGMVEAGVTSVGGSVGGPWADFTASWAHHRTTFGGPSEGSGGRDPALQATITRIEQAR